MEQTKKQVPALNEKNEPVCKNKAHRELIEYSKSSKNLNKK